MLTVVIVVSRYGPCEKGDPDICINEPRWNFTQINLIRHICHLCQTRRQYEKYRASHSLKDRWSARKKVRGIDDDEDEEDEDEEDEEKGTKIINSRFYGSLDKKALTVDRKETQQSKDKESALNKAREPKSNNGKDIEQRMEDVVVEDTQTEQASPASRQHPLRSPPVR